MLYCLVDCHIPRAELEICGTADLKVAHRENISRIMASRRRETTVRCGGDSFNPEMQLSLEIWIKGTRLCTKWNHDG